MKCPLTIWKIDKYVSIYNFQTYYFNPCIYTCFLPHSGLLTHKFLDCGRKQEPGQNPCRQRGPTPLNAACSLNYYCQFSSSNRAAVVSLNCSQTRGHGLIHGPVKIDVAFFLLCFRTNKQLHLLDQLFLRVSSKKKKKKEV